VAVLGALLVPVAGGAQSSFNVTLHWNANTYAGTNDCWGYTSPGGTEIAIFGHQTGTAFVDATDPPNAVEIWNLPGPTSIWRDIKTYQHYAYVVTEGGGAGTGLQIVDLADPLNPVHVGTYTGAGFTTAHNLWIDVPTGVAYACGSTGGMHILSLANPEAPVELDFFTPYYIHDLWVGDGVAYAGAISSGSLRIIDVTNPSNPFTIASHFYAGANTHNAWPNAAKTHVLTTDEVSLGHVKVWDITALPAISLAAEYTAPDPAIVHNVLIEDEIAYMSYYAAGTRIVDVTDPTNPVEVGHYDTTTRQGGFDGCWGVYPFRADDVYYASDRQNGFFILEFTGALAGEVQGTVRDAVSAAPLDSAYVAIAGAPAALATGAAGTYGTFLSGGSYQVVTTRFGYEPDTSSVVIPPDGIVVHDVDLTPLPSGTVELTVVSSHTGLPVQGAIVDLAGTPIVGRVTDAAGQVMLPGLPSGMPWTVRAGRFGHAVTEQAVTSQAGMTIAAEIEMPPGFADDFDLDQAWIVGDASDTATDGIWERAVPVGSYSLGLVGPDQDASPAGAGYAYVTENHVSGAFVGTSDVDGGPTTLKTPVFDATGLGELTIGYTRWFSNRAPSPGDDEFRVDVSTDGGGSWTNLETLTVGTDSWSQVQIPLLGIVPLTSAMQLRFVAEDLPPNQYVEAGVDDVVFASTATAAPPVVAARLELALERPAPNPFRESTQVAFALPRAGRVSLTVHDVAGRRVATLLAADRLGAGRHRAAWDGRDDRGRAAAPGVYFARLVTDEGTLSRKMAFLR